MVDFLEITESRPRKDIIEIYPDFRVGYVKDLMIRGQDFYAFWDAERNIWCQSEQDLINMIDLELNRYYEKNKEKYSMFNVSIKYMGKSSTKMIDRWHNYVKSQMRDQFCSLDENLVFADQETKKSDYSSKRLSYNLTPGSTENYDELISTLYSESERHKIEWCIGAVISGESKHIHKFAVFYGAPGTGKSTIINIIQDLFEGYYMIFDAEMLGSANASFPLEQMKQNALVAICHDTDLSHIEKNAIINSLVAHEKMPVNEKHKAIYVLQFISFLFIGTNKPVRITDRKSGIIRRLIDIHPTGNKIKLSLYNKLIKGIKFELGAIAAHCLKVYEDAPDYYEDYEPLEMMGETNDFYNFVADSYDIFKRDNGVTLKAAWEMYKVYCEEAKVPYPFSMRAFKTELKNYFRTYEERITIGEERIRNYYSGFKYELLVSTNDNKEEEPKEELHMDFKVQPSILDELLKDCKAQYGNKNEIPRAKWEDVKTTLKDLNTRRLHYVKTSGDFDNLIHIDFDKKGSDGNKCFALNEQEALKWPRTYAEKSKSGGGIHLTYFYDGDPSKLVRDLGDDVEVKVMCGNSSIRRCLTECTNDPIAHLPVGSIPLKEEKLVNFESIKDQQHLVNIIKKCLRKDIENPSTRCCIDLIYKSLEDAYNSGLSYNVMSLYNAVVAFAAQSTHQADYCLKLVAKMHFMSDDVPDNLLSDDNPIGFFDIEVYPNLLLICYKERGKDKKIYDLINPSPSQIENFITKFRLIGFNNRRYDNHVVYGALIGNNNDETYKLSKSIINSESSKEKYFYPDAYNLSYTDIYDYCSAANKMSLKKWEIKLKIHHKEMNLPWDKPVPMELWSDVIQYCHYDVEATEATFDATQEDFRAREILADLAGMTVNDTTNSLTTRIIFGTEKHPQLVYTHLDTGEQEGPPDQINKSKYINKFPGYEFIRYWDDKIKRFVRQNMYRGTDLGLGGYVYAEPGMYYNVALLDVASMHPHSILAMNVFGKYTKNYEDIVNTRIHIKHEEYDIVENMFDGKLKKYLINPAGAGELSGALKTPINAVYGLTSATFPNPFKDPRNENNIVAVRGALFMRTLQDEVAKRGFTVAHIKTDSIKIPNATPEIIQFCMDFAKKYGYEFEHEATYKKMCLVNDAVYIAKYMSAEEANELYGYSPKECKKHGGEWTATGTQFAVPYVFKHCFSHEPIEFDDMCEIKQVKTAMYIMNGPEDKEPKFVGKVGLFCPMVKGTGGGLLVKEQTKKDGSVGLDSVTGTKGYEWMEAEDVVNNQLQDYIDKDYYKHLVDEAIEAIDQYGDYEQFVD